MEKNMTHESWRQARLVVALAISTLLTSACATASQPEDRPTFEGAWETTWCDPRDPKRECGFFELYLTQEHGRICGGHSVATLGLARLDEGEYDSVKGTFHRNRATVVVLNTRTGSTHLATATLEGDQLQWKMVGMLTEGESDEPAIIPREQSLRRSTRASALEMVSTIKQLPCRWPDETKVPATR